MGPDTKFQNFRTAILNARTTVGDRAIVVLFGDSRGFTLFLAIVTVLFLTWRVGFLINDNYTIANELVAIADGHLIVDAARYGPGLDTPGMRFLDGNAYGRNYALAFLALPIFWVLQGLAAIADLRLVLVGTWCLLILATSVAIGKEIEHPSSAAIIGSMVALVVFGVNVQAATQLEERWIPLLALQLIGIVAAGAVAVIVYRLLSRMYDQRIGLFAGFAAALATPIGFWATIPKRHVLITSLVLLTVYFLYRSRETPSSETRYRALAYATVGVSAWVFSGAAMLLFITLAVVDIPTADDNGLKALSKVSAGLVTGLLPFFITNWVISGNPLAPPMMIGTNHPVVEGSTGGGSPDTPPSGGDSANPSMFVLVYGLITSILAPLQQLMGRLTGGLSRILSDPSLLVEVFLRIGWQPGISSRDMNQAVNLSILESAPITAGVFAGSLHARPLMWARSARRGDAKVIVDVFVLLFSILLILFYLRVLPIHLMITVRYLLPIYPLAIYGLARMMRIRDVVHDRPWSIFFGYAGTVLIGSQLFLITTTLTSAGIGEAMQLHAVVGLLAAGILILCAMIDRYHSSPTVYGVLLGITGGLGTVLMLHARIQYFQFAGNHILPIIG